MTHLLASPPPRSSGPLAALLLVVGTAVWFALSPPTEINPPTRLDAAAERSVSSGLPKPVRAKLARLAAGAFPAFDRPGEAVAFARSKRLGDPLGSAAAAEGIDPPALYARARARIESLPVYSSRMGRRISRDELDALQRGELPDLRRRTGAANFATWKFLGPGNIGGRTRALSVDPDNPRVMIAGGVSGGIWKTTDGGGSWRPKADLVANIAVNSIARHPDNPRILYAGTGEGYFREAIRGTALPLRGGGILESRDGGESWRRLPATVNANFHWVNDLVVSPHDGRRIYAATRTGLWRTRNGGGSWQPVIDPADPAGCIDLEVRTDAAGDFLFATCGLFEQASVWRNPNAQADAPWEQVLVEPFQGRTNVALAPSDPNVVYALAASNEDGVFDQGLLALFRSDQAGAAGSWRRRTDHDDPVPLHRLLLSNPLAATLTECQMGESFLSNLGWHTNLLAVDPLDPDRVWAGGVDLFRSDDGGATWGVASYWWIDESRPSHSHADHHELVFHPGYDGAGNRTAFDVNDGGVYRLDDARASVAAGALATCDPALAGTPFRSLNRGYGATQFYHGAPFPGGRRYLGGAQDNGTVLGGDAGGPDAWRRVFGGDGGYVAVDPDNPDVIYVEAQFGTLQRSRDGGQTLEPATEGISDERFLFITPFVLDPSPPQRLWIGGTRLWRSEDGADTWTAASTPLANGGRVSALAVAPGRPERVLAGTHLGSIHRTDRALVTDGSTAWPGVRPRDGFVSSLAFDPRDPDVAYATYARFGGDHVWKSTDGGRSWQPLRGSGQGRLPDLPVHSLVVDPVFEGRLFLGTDLGVFVSLDGGESWAVENTGFANAVTETLALSENPDGSTDLFAFTHGRGAWRVRLLAPPEDEPPLRARRLLR